LLEAESVGVLGTAVVSLGLGAGFDMEVESAGVPGTAPVSPLSVLPQAASAATTTQGNARVCHLMDIVLSSVSSQVTLGKRT
jgi:hypothetical protein